MNDAVFLVDELCVDPPQELISMYEVVFENLGPPLFTGTQHQCAEFIRGLMGLYDPNDFRIQKVKGGDA